MQWDLCLALLHLKARPFAVTGTFSCSTSIWREIPSKWCSWGEADTMRQEREFSYQIIHYSPLVLLPRQLVPFRVQGRRMSQCREFAPWDTILTGRLQIVLSVARSAPWGRCVPLERTGQCLALLVFIAMEPEWQQPHLVRAALTVPQGPFMPNRVQQVRLSQKILKKKQVQFSLLYLYCFPGFVCPQARLAAPLPCPSAGSCTSPDNSNVECPTAVGNDTRIFGTVNDDRVDVALVDWSGFRIATSAKLPGQGTLFQVQSVGSSKLSWSVLRCPMAK